MPRLAKPTTGPFGSAIRSHRQEIGLSKGDLASQLGWSVSFVDALETGRRGCDLDDLPQLADILGVEARGLFQAYVKERHSRLYTALYGEEQPQVGLELAGTHVEDVHWRLDHLPRRERGIVEALIYAFSDLLKDRRSDGRE